jgi:hypothetical protein
VRQVLVVVVVVAAAAGEVAGEGEQQILLHN